MRFTNAFIPHRAYWSTPFCKWQGSFADLHPVRFAADVAVKGLARREISPEVLDQVVLGWTIPSKQVFYGAPYLAALVGAPGITGAMISQACATSAAAIAHAAAQVACGGSEASLVVLADKCSNGPHVVYPNPAGPGGKPDAEDWVWDSFNCDPWAKNAMIETAENVARSEGITREEQDAMTLLRYEQYTKAVEAGFHGRFFVAPYEVNPTGRKVVRVVEHDEGIFPTTEEGLAKLRPVLRDGTVTFGSQTHPADGNAGLLVCSKARAEALSGGESPVEIVSYGTARVAKGMMAKAVVPAARRALEAAGISVGDLASIKTHNPFAVNDVYFSRGMGVAPEDFNRTGSSLVFGHPQGPTGARLLVEGIEEALEAGGGYVLFAGCAAGDTAAALVVRV